MTETKAANRLIHEKSPYLLQHAHNPVDWHPWGAEAFEKAKKVDKPVLVSIGYATCHWCHVMERESFENPAAAALMNEVLVCIKVDREERPDVDKVYMTAAQALTGGGGWPLNVFLTPEGKPFLAGTYFPPRDGGGRPAWTTLVRHVGEAWRNPEGRQELAGRGQQLMAGLARYLSAPAAEGSADLTALAAEALPAALETFRRSYDADQGGFSPAPKFPMPIYQHFLFRAWAFARSDAAALGRDEALETLRRMARGGIYDHLGGGFARYSTDGRWHVPHFEKMLYDNAQLAVNHIDAYQITKEEAFSRTARETLDYVLRDMTHPGGGFYSAEDADSLPAAGAKEKSEGAFYVWEEKELADVLGPARAKLFNEAYGVEARGNVEQDPHGEFPNKNVLYQALTAEQTAARSGVPPEEVDKELKAARQRLFEVRARRPRPFLDDKVLMSWNGLMISAFARAARAFDEPRYLEAALRAARFLQKNLLGRGGEGPLRRWRDGEAAIPAMADDHAFLAQGFLDLYEASGDAEWLRQARSLTDRFLERFFDPAAGAVYMTEAGHDPRLALRPVDDGDNVEPAAASVAALTLLRLGHFFDEARYRKAGETILSAHGPLMAESPRQLPFMFSALLFSLAKTAQVVVAGDPMDPRTKALWAEVNRRFLPHAVLIAADGGPHQAALAERLPFLKSAGPVDGKPAAYLCRDYACRRPTPDPAELGRQLDE